MRSRPWKRLVGAVVRDRQPPIQIYVTTSAIAASVLEPRRGNLAIG